MEPDLSTARYLVVGAGYLGQRVAALWKEQGEGVAVTTRARSRADTWAKQGYLPLVMDVTRPDIWPELPQVHTLFWAVGYDRQAGRSQREVYVDGLQHLLDRLPATVQRVIYASSTGVYGDAGGDWVDEATLCQPEREGGRLTWEAESLLRTHPLGADRVIILRFAGLYGPGRIPHLAALQAGEPLPVPAEGYLNLIHIEDAARLVVAAESLTPPELLNVSDGCPVLRADYYRAIGLALNVEVQFAAPDGNDMRSQRAAANKRILNRKLLERLPLTLRYPTYREGIASILNHR